jgi:FkbM family methyltransferase
MHLTDDKKIWIPDDDYWDEWGVDYEKNEFDDIMNHHITKWDVALDVGAHVGIWSMRLAEKFKRVYAFEPVPKHIECWKQNVTNFTNEHIEWENFCTLNTVALGDENGTATIQVPKTTNSGMASLVQLDKTPTPGWENFDNFPRMKIETRTLDSYEFDQVDFIKIDVEWFELNVLQGAENTIRKHKPIMYIEISDSKVYNFMENLNLDYRIFYEKNSSFSQNSLFKVDSDFDNLMESFSPTPATRHALTKLRLSDLYGT